MEETTRMPVKDAGRVSVDVNKFGHGMETLFTGMSEVFGSLGAVSLPEYRPASKSAPGPSVKKDKAQGQKDGKPSGEDKAESGDVAPDAPDGSAETPGKPEAAGPTTEQTPAPETPNNAPQPISLDDITSVIVAKIKQKRDNSEAIQSMLITYGAKKVSELKPDCYEAFMTGLAQI